MKTPFWIALIVVAFVAGMGIEYLSNVTEALGPWKCVVPDR